MRARIIPLLSLLAAISLTGCQTSRLAIEIPHTVISDLEPALQLIATGRYVEASAELAPMAETARAQGRPDIASQAIFWQGYCAEKTDLIADALRLYGEVVTTYPGTPAARQSTERAEMLRITTKA
jgi:hypothetical protein